MTFIKVHWWLRWSRQWVVSSFFSNCALIWVEHFYYSGDNSHLSADGGELLCSSMSPLVCGNKAISHRERGLKSADTYSAYLNKRERKKGHQVPDHLWKKEIRGAVIPLRKQRWRRWGIPTTRRSYKAIKSAGLSTGRVMGKSFMLFVTSGVWSR